MAAFLRETHPTDPTVSQISKRKELHFLSLELELLLQLVERVLEVSREVP